MSVMSKFQAFYLNIKQWISSWFHYEEEEKDNLYKPKQRHIYSYWDGTNLIKADPIVLWKKVMGIWPELSIDMRVANSPSRDALQAHEAMIRKIRELFTLKSLEEGGLSELEAIGLLDHFLLFCNITKKNSSPSATTQTGTSPVTPEPTTPSGEKSSTPSPATPNTSDSGSTVKESTSVEPTPSHSEQVLHSE